MCGIKKVAVIYDAISRGLIRVRHNNKGKMEINPETQRPAFFRMKAKLGEGIRSIPKSPVRRKPGKRARKEVEDLEGEDYLVNEPPNVDSEDMTGLRASKARKEKALARKAELEAAEREGQLVSLEDVVTRRKEVGIILQKAILAIPDRVSPIIAGERNAEKVNTILSAELKRTLRDLSLNLKKELVKKNGTGRKT
jgi:hypothetical protein